MARLLNLGYIVPCTFLIKCTNNEAITIEIHVVAVFDDCTYCASVLCVGLRGQGGYMGPFGPTST